MESIISAEDEVSSICKLQRVHRVPLDLHVTLRKQMLSN